MFRNEISIEYRPAAVDAVLRGGKAIGALHAEAEADADALERGLAAERAVDSVLADSFPASDPPSWTLGIAHPPAEREATSVEAMPPEHRAVGSAKSDVIDVYRPGTDGRTFLEGLVSLAGAAGIALLVPFVILLIGMPIALAVTGVVEAAGWLIRLAFG
jgi:hypothetical protein